MQTELFQSKHIISPISCLCNYTCNLQQHIKKMLSIRLSARKQLSPDQTLVTYLQSILAKITEFGDNLVACSQSLYKANCKAKLTREGRGRGQNVVLPIILVG